MNLGCSSRKNVYSFQEPIFGLFQLKYDPFMNVIKMRINRTLVFVKLSVDG